MDRKKEEENSAKACALEEKIKPLKERQQALLPCSKSNSDQDLEINSGNLSPGEEPSSKESEKILHYSCEKCGNSLSPLEPIDKLAKILYLTRLKPCLCGYCEIFEGKYERNQVQEETSCESKHKKLHTRGRPHVVAQKRVHSCKICGKILASSANLRKHKKLHTRERLHSCENCKATFAYRQNYLRHKRTASKSCPKILSEN